MARCIPSASRSSTELCGKSAMPLRDSCLRSLKVAAPIRVATVRSVGCCGDSPAQAFTASDTRGADWCLRSVGARRLRERPRPQRICVQCHEYERSVAPRQDRAGWRTTMDKMIALGAKGTPKEFDAIVDYLSQDVSRRGSSQDQGERGEGNRTGKRAVAAAFPSGGDHPVSDEERRLQID